MNTAVVCIGTNISNVQSIPAGCPASSEDAIKSANCMLMQNGCEIIRSSGIFASNDVYQNEVVEVSLCADYQDAVSLAKQIECDLGRTPQMKQIGLVPIDLDIVIFNGEVKRPADYGAYYFKMGYQRLQ